MVVEDWRIRHDRNVALRQSMQNFFLSIELFGEASDLLLELRNFFRRHDARYVNKAQSLSGGNRSAQLLTYGYKKDSSLD